MLWNTGEVTNVRCLHKWLNCIRNCPPPIPYEPPTRPTTTTTTLPPVTPKCVDRADDTQACELESCPHPETQRISSTQTGSIKVFHCEIQCSQNNADNAYLPGRSDLYVDGILLRVVFIAYKNDIPCEAEPPSIGDRVRCLNTDSNELPLEPLLPELGANSAYPPPHFIVTPPRNPPDGQVCQVDTRPLDCADAERSSQADSQDTYIAPTDGELSAGYGLGPNPHGRGTRMHHGVDIIHENDENTENIDERYCKPVFAAAGGYVTYTVSRTDHRNFGSYGLFVRIDHHDRTVRNQPCSNSQGGAQGGAVSIYLHLAKVAVSSGYRVKKGDVIGYVGSSGLRPVFSGGTTTYKASSLKPHLHFELRIDCERVNPRCHINLSASELFYPCPEPPTPEPPETTTTTTTTTLAPVADRPSTCIQKIPEGQECGLINCPRHTLEVSLEIDDGVNKFRCEIICSAANNGQGAYFPGTSLMYQGQTLWTIVSIVYKDGIACETGPPTTDVTVRCVNTDSEELPLEPLLSEPGPDFGSIRPHVIAAPPADPPDGQVCQLDTRPLDCVDAERSSQYSSQDAYIAPTDGKLVTGYGLEPAPHRERQTGPHSGVDIIHENDENTQNIDERYCKPVFAIADGTVYSTIPTTDHRHFGPSGLLIGIEHDSPNQRCRVGPGRQGAAVSKYLYLAKVEVSRGDKVKKGDVIGYVGATGLWLEFSEGTAKYKAIHERPTLHFELRFNCESVNPRCHINLVAIASDLTYPCENPPGNDVCPAGEPSDQVGSYIFPSDGSISKEFEILRSGKIVHSGIDLIANDLTLISCEPVYASHSGVISAKETGQIYATQGVGNFVRIEAEVGAENGVVSSYGYLKSVLVSLGQQVTKGDVIGFVGSTGQASYGQLYFEIKRDDELQNPRCFVFYEASEFNTGTGAILKKITTSTEFNDARTEVSVVIKTVTTINAGNPTTEYMITNIITRMCEDSPLVEEA